MPDDFRRARFASGEECFMVGSFLESSGEEGGCGWSVREGASMTAISLSSVGSVFTVTPIPVDICQ